MPANRMPVAFFAHGSPMNVLEHNRYTEAWAAMAHAVPAPKAILAISAHWVTRGPAVTANERQKTIHDFHGFPQELYALEYNAPGDPELAERVRELLAPVQVAADTSWGLDHGSWSVLLHAYPGATVPVIQLSMDGTQPASFHFDIASRLAPLREEQIFIAGFGNVVHNLRLMKRNASDPAYDWALGFERAVHQAILERDHETLIHFERRGEAARLSVPTPEHYLPLLYAIGLQRSDEPARITVEGIENGSLSMLSALLG